MTPLHDLRRRSGGFSLIELLTIVALIGILASLAVPRMSLYLAQNRARRALDRISSDLSYARITAVQRSQRTFVTIQPDGDYTLDTLAVNGVDKVPFKRVDLSQDVPGLTVVAGSVVEYEFSSRGLVKYGSDTADGELTVTVGEARESFFVSPSGRIFRAY
jgi:Tfp pilus assembly protein FimT